MFIRLRNKTDPDDGFFIRNAVLEKYPSSWLLHYRNFTEKAGSSPDVHFDGDRLDLKILRMIFNNEIRITNRGVIILHSPKGIDDVDMENRISRLVDYFHFVEPTYYNNVDKQIMVNRQKKRNLYNASFYDSPFDKNSVYSNNLHNFKENRNKLKQNKTRALKHNLRRSELGSLVENNAFIAKIESRVTTKGRKTGLKPVFWRLPASMTRKENNRKDWKPKPKGGLNERGRIGRGLNKQ